ncbi:phosphate system positive regulatory protein pho81 [Microbotryomycetes sp. JL221]|nr:phosphate system positive regulatory protein pho81 [Microbotryomycetes sp. JL221]
MKFGKQIQAQQLPGWSQYYVDYKGLKKIINSLAKGRPADAALLAAGIRPPSATSATQQQQQQHGSNLEQQQNYNHGDDEFHSRHPALIPQTADRHNGPLTNGHVGATANGQGTLLQAHKAAFFFKLERELEKINAFYYQRESALKVRLRTLIDKRKLLTASLSDSQGKVKPLSRDSSSYGALYEGFRNFERDLGRLQTYIELNATAFRKICKKWDKACRRQADRFGDKRPEQGEHDGQLYLARQVEVQPVFNREFIAELSDVASANLLSLDNLTGGDSKRRGEEALADGTGIDTKGGGGFAPGSRATGMTPSSMWTMDLESAGTAEALEDLEHALVVAVHARDQTATKEILRILLPPSQNEVRAPVSRILWRAVLEEPEQSQIAVDFDMHEDNQSQSQISKSNLIPTSLLDFAFVDDINGRTGLHEAASAGRLSLVELCLRRGVSVAQADVYGRHPLHYAAINGHAQVCRLLVNAKADPKVLDLDGYSSITYAITNGRTSVVETFMDQGVNCDEPAVVANVSTSNPSTLGTAAATSTAMSEDLNALSLACQYGHHDIARLLLDRGAKILPNQAGYWPQHLAAREGHAAVLRILVDASRGFSGIDVPDKYSQATPLTHAASEGHVECVNVLLQAGSNVHARDEFRRTPIHYAAWQGHIDCVNLLLAAGASSKLQDDDESDTVLSGGAKGEARLAEGVSTHVASPDPPMDPLATGNMSSADVEPMDFEADMIPSLSLPPPIIPFRIYGHSYLDKKTLVQVFLGHPNTTRAPFPPPIRLNEQSGRGHYPSLKLIMAPKPDQVAAPHSVILPLADEREAFPFQVDSFNEFSLEFDVLPTFGSKLLGKAVAVTSTFDSLRSQGSYTIPLVDPSLQVIGDIPFEVNIVKPFERATLQLGGQFETYWRSTTQVSSTGEPVAANQGGITAGSSVVTASSLSGDHVRMIVQVTSDGTPVVFPQWRLPVEGFDLHVADVTLEQFLALAVRLGKHFDMKGVQDENDPAMWYQAIASSLMTLEQALTVLPMQFGVNLEVRYPTLSDSRRLKIHNQLEVNDFVDQVLSTVYESVQNSKDVKHHRRIVLSSFNPVVCTALNWKQPNFSVFFASHCGLSRSSPEGQMVPANRVEDDRRCTSIREAVKFAKANNLLGVMLDATILVQVPSLIQSAKEHGLLITTFGTTRRVALADAHMSSGVLSYASSNFLKQTEAS